MWPLTWSQTQACCCAARGGGGAVPGGRVTSMRGACANHLATPPPFSAPLELQSHVPLPCTRATGIIRPTTSRRKGAAAADPPPAAFQVDVAQAPRFAWRQAVVKGERHEAVDLLHTSITLL